jgi:hypothetical protein
VNFSWTKKIYPKISEFANVDLYLQHADGLPCKVNHQCVANASHRQEVLRLHSIDEIIRCCEDDKVRFDWAKDVHMFPMLNSIPSVIIWLTGTDKTVTVNIIILK